MVNIVIVAAIHSRVAADDGELFLNGLSCNREVSFCAAALGCKRCKSPVQCKTEPGFPFMHM